MDDFDTELTHSISFDSSLGTLHCDLQRQPLSVSAAKLDKSVVTLDNTTVRKRTKRMSVDALISKWRGGIEHDKKMMRKSFKTVFILTIILGTYLMLGAYMFWYIEDCMNGSVDPSVLAPSSGVFRSYKTICRSMNASGTLQQWIATHSRDTLDSKDVVDATYSSNTLDSREVLDVTAYSKNTVNMDPIVHCAQLLMSMVSGEQSVRHCKMSTYDFVKWTHFTAASCFTIGE